MLLCLTGTAAADAPAPPTITEPGTEGEMVNSGDVHMEVAPFPDDDGDALACTDWEIRTADLSEVAWRANCATDTLAVHIHLADGSYVSPFRKLEFGSSYVLRARFHDTEGQTSDWAQRSFRTVPPGPPGGDVSWTAGQPGYSIDEVAGGLQLPTNIAFVPNPGTAPGDPLLYITELYGTIKVVANDGAVSDYATGLLNFNPTGNFPGSGETGLAGIAVDPASGDVFASLVYDGAPPNGPHYPEVIRLHSEDGGRTAATVQDVIRMAGETQGASHQIGSVSIGPDGKLYVHVGDGLDVTTSEDLNSMRGKVLRMNLDGSPPADNPFYDAGDGITATDYIYAYGLRNPFGGAWRASNGKLYEVENGPSVDRLARVDPGANYGFDGSDTSMRTLALYNWEPAHAPVNIAFVQPETFGGSGFPASQQDHAFVTESGPTWADGPQPKGKRVVEFDPNPGTGELAGPPHDLATYTGTGKATAVGLAAGPDGLYFTELYRDRGSKTPIDPGARLLRIRYGPPLAPELRSTNPRSPANRNTPAVMGSARTIGSTVLLYSSADCRTLLATGTAEQFASGIGVRVKDNTTTSIYARAAVGSATSACSGPLTYVERSPRAFKVKAARRRCNKRFHGKRRVRCLKRVKEKARRR